MNAREAALGLLTDVLRKRRPLDHASGLDPRDAGFAFALASETMRRFGQLDALLRGFTSKLPPPHKSGLAVEIMLMGACELVFLKTAPHAAVDGANRLAQADNKAVHFKPLINAVLRRISREGADAIAAQDAARLNTPDWLWLRWVAAYGETTARAIASAHLHQAPLDLVWKTPPVAPLFGNVQRMEPQRVEALPGFAEGEFWVQDAAATLPAHLLGDVRGQRVIDLCAAPGGKTAQLAAHGAIVTAVERDGTRLARLKENLARLKLDATPVEADMRDADIAPAPFVLLDAPCTATGTIRRHPRTPLGQERLRRDAGRRRERGAAGPRRRADGARRGCLSLQCVRWSRKRARSRLRSSWKSIRVRARVSRGIGCLRPRRIHRHERRSAHAAVSSHGARRHGWVLCGEAAPHLNLPPCGEVEKSEGFFGWGYGARRIELPPPDVLASLRASISPQGGG